MCESLTERGKKKEREVRAGILKRSQWHKILLDDLLNIYKTFLKFKTSQTANCQNNLQHKTQQNCIFIPSLELNISGYKLKCSGVVKSLTKLSSRDRCSRFCWTASTIPAPHSPSWLTSARRSLRRSFGR